MPASRGAGVTSFHRPTRRARRSRARRARSSAGCSTATARDDGLALGQGPCPIRCNVVEFGAVSRASDQASFHRKKPRKRPPPRHSFGQRSARHGRCRQGEDTMSHRKRDQHTPPLKPVAGNGLLDRRALLGGSLVVAGAMTSGVSATGAAAEPLQNGPWSLGPGVPVPPYGQPSKFEQKVVRTLSNPKLEPRGSAARTPHHLLNGTITPNGLHFVIARGGETHVDPDKHRLVIHGLVKQPMVYTVDALHRYPMVSRITFVECGGNSAPLYSKDPIQA